MCSSTQSEWLLRHVGLCREELLSLSWYEDDAGFRSASLRLFRRYRMTQFRCCTGRNTDSNVGDLIGLACAVKLGSGGLKRPGQLWVLLISNASSALGEICGLNITRMDARIPCLELVL